MQISSFQTYLQDRLNAQLEENGRILYALCRSMLPVRRTSPKPWSRPGLLSLIHGPCPRDVAEDRLASRSADGACSCQIRHGTR